MIIGTMTVTIPKWMRATTAVAVAAVVAIFLAIGGSSIEDNLGIRTPGTLASHALVPPKPQDWLGDQLGMQIFVDSIFWFAVMCGIYFLVTKLGQKSKSAPKPWDART
jgi:hypothetical protein